VTFTATDDGNGTGTPETVSITVPIEVRNTNRVPALGPITNQVVARDTVLELPVSAADPTATRSC